MEVRRVLAIAAACLVFDAAHGADKPCTKADAASAEKAIDRVLNWPQLQKTWQDYRHCDTAGTGDLYTEALMRLMVDWKNVDALAASMQKDAQYKEFIYAHLKSPAAKDDYATIYSRARASCPKGMDEFCAELAETVKPAK